MLSVGFLGCRKRIESYNSMLLSEHLFNYYLFLHNLWFSGKGCSLSFSIPFYEKQRVFANLFDSGNHTIHSGNCIKSYQTIIDVREIILRKRDMVIGNEEGNVALRFRYLRITINCVFSSKFASIDCALWIVLATLQISCGRKPSWRVGNKEIHLYGTPCTSQATSAAQTSFLFAFFCNFQ